MAMDALKNLVNNIPYWIDRLTKLRDEIDLRQIELAAVAAAERKSPETKSLRNKGSTESLKPNGDPPVVPAEAPTNKDILEDINAESAAQTPVETPDALKVQTPSPGSIRQQQEEARAGAQVRKKPKSPSIMSNEDAPTTYRTRITIIVCYDSNVQVFLVKLLRFVSSCRNLIRKAKLAVKIAQIKKLVEQDNDEALPSLRYMSKKRYGLLTRAQPPKVYDDLDKGLEFVYSMCKHQVLRDGDDKDGIGKVWERLAEILEMAKTELERLQREEPELAKETGEMGKEGSSTRTKEETKLEPAKLEAAWHLHCAYGYGSRPHRG